MTGVRRPGAASEDLYFGNQDTGSFGSVDAGAVKPAWTNQMCCDGFDVAGEPTRVLSTICCFSPPPKTRLFLSQPGFAGAPVEVPEKSLPPGLLPEFKQLRGIANFDVGNYVILTSSGVFVTADIAASTIMWTQLGAGSSPANACGVQVTRQGSAIVFFVKSGGCNGDQPGALFRYSGTAAGGTWQAVPGAGNVGVYSVDPGNPDRIIISDVGGAMPAMRMTSNGGTVWNALPALDTLMTGGGTFRYRTHRGPTAFTRFNGYPQPTLLAIDPNDGRNILAGGADSGVFLSRDGGTNWKLVSDPNSPGISGRPHVPRPRYAHFDHDTPGKLTVYIGTQGRGTWRLID